MKEPPPRTTRARRQYSGHRLAGKAVENLLRLKAVGVDGVQWTFFVFAEDLRYVGETVWPLTAAAGLRVPQKA